MTNDGERIEHLLYVFTKKNCNNNYSYYIIYICLVFLSVLGRKYHFFLFNYIEKLFYLFPAEVVKSEIFQLIIFLISKLRTKVY